LRLTLKKSGRMFWCSGTCADSNLDLVGQTSMIMQGLDASLRTAGSGFADVVKLTAHYTGSASEAELHGNMKVRHGYYASPGPASTGLPVKGLGNDRCRIAIDIAAM
jgi:enamine deaminase RidA (YjgF/YER057c/UK114 family)